MASVKSGRARAARENPATTEHVNRNKIFALSCYSREFNELRALHDRIVLIACGTASHTQSDWALEHASEACRHLSIVFEGGYALYQKGTSKMFDHYYAPLLIDALQTGR